MNNIIIIYVENKNLVIKQINKLIKDKININFIILLDTYEYLQLFSNYGIVIICGDEQFLSKKIQMAYNYIKQNKDKYNYIFELNQNFIIDSNYINKCIEQINNYDIIGSNSYISYSLNTKEMMINISKKIDNKIYCRCINKKFLDKIEWKIFDFNKNIDIYELSHTFCILNSVETKYIINNLVFKIINNNFINYYYYQYKIVSESLFNKINNIINYNINMFFNKKNIKQIYVSNDLIFFKNIIKKKYNLIDNISILTNEPTNEPATLRACHLASEPCLFFGIYNMDDYLRLKNYTGLKYILWGGSDIDTRLELAKKIIPKVLEIKGLNHFAISESIYKRLENLKIKSTLINFSLVDQSIYNLSNINYNLNKPNTIYIYNGNKSSNPLIYNTELINQIVLKLNNKYNIIYSSDLCINNAKMIDIYSNCFMGIRLCENDGNANTVQEMGLIGLPVLHNGLYPNSVPWFNDIDLICEKIDYIYNNFWNRRNIIAESMEKYLSEDKRENMCIFVPMWYRHETTEKNIHLLSKQIYQKTKIILIYSNEEDKIFAQNLEYKYTNLYSIEVENRPLSKKFQYGAEFCKIFYPKGIIINGSDDFLSLNYSKCVKEYFNKSYNYIGCNFWYVGDLASMLLYKFKYKDNNRVVGCGRAFKYDLLNTLNWQVFPLDRNSGIDGASKVMIENYAIFKNLEENKCFTFSFKEKTDMITPMSNLLKSEHNTHEIISDINLLKIMYSTNLYELETTFKFQETSISNNLYLFVTLLDDNLKRSNPVMLNSYYMEKVLDPYFDIIDIRNLDKVKYFNYKLIFIDGIALNTRTNKLDKNNLFLLLSKIKNIPKVLLAHDIHDYSFDFDMNCQPEKHLIKRDLKPNYEFNKLKKNFLEFLRINKIEYLISICDCPEYDLMVKYYSKQIKKFYLLTHHIPQEIFYYKKIEKKWDILIYGWTNSDIVYPFRTRLKKILSNSNFRINIIERTGDITKMPIENELADIINQSWITITCISNFSYLVRKYFEIAACGSIPCGNINKQGKYIFKNNMIELDENMSDYEILRIITYYLENPELLINMSNNIKNIAISYNYNMFMKKLLEIKDNIINNIDSELTYNNIKKEYDLIDNNLEIYEIINTTKLLKWIPNQNSIINYHEHDKIFTVQINQDKSTPGIKINQLLKPGQFIISFNFISSCLNCSIFCFTKNNKQITINEHNECDLYSGYFNILIEDTYILYILITNPKISEIFTLKNINLKQIEPKYISNKLYSSLPEINNNFNLKICYGSISCIGELNKLHSTFNGTCLSKDDILKKTWLQKNNNLLSNDSKYFVLLGLYSAHHWHKIYKPLFDKFERIMIIFTGTDILQLDKVLPELKEEIILTLKTNKFILGALNNRNQIEIYEKHNLKCNIISLPVGINLKTNQISKKSKKIACYVGSNLSWYCFDILKTVAKMALEYEFYIYKYDGFTDEFINDPENNISNIIYNRATIENFNEFMKDKLCSLRITLHDGEPMTGIETMIMGKYFIFNHEMKYSIQTTKDPIDIIKKLNQVYNLVNKDINLDENVEKYYLLRNSTKIFERNLYGYFSLNNNILVTLDENKEIINNKSNLDLFTTTYNVKLDKNINYVIVLNGYTDGYAYMQIDTNSHINIINSKYNKIENFETITWIEFISNKDISININLIMGSPKLNEKIFIRSLAIYK